MVLPRVFKMNCLSSLKSFVYRSQVLKRFYQGRNLVLPRSNRLNLMSGKITYHKYCTKTSQALGASRTSSCNKELEENDIGNEEDEDLNDYSDLDDGDVSDTERENENQKNIEEVFEEIAQGNPDILKKLKTLEFEVTVLREQGAKVPLHMKKSQWGELLAMADASTGSKRKLLAFMSGNEKIELLQLKRKQTRKLKCQKKKAEAGFHFYGLSGHSVLPNVTDRKLNRLLNLRQLMAEQKILFDCSYQEFMNEKCLRNLGKQIHMSLMCSKVHQYPCQLAFCNLKKDDLFGKIITSYVPQIFNENFYCDVSPTGILDNYPKEKLVYLSPHAQNDLLEVNKSDIYVIGGYVDKGKRVKASLAKAKKDHIRVARLPIDHYMCWRQGDKSLPLNIVVNIILDMFYYNDWNIAFNCISSRAKDSFSQMKYDIPSNNEFNDVRELK